MTVRRQPRLHPADARQLGGMVSITPARDRIDGLDFFSVSHISRGGDVVWTSPRIPDIDRATAAAECLAAFVGAQVRR